MPAASRRRAGGSARWLAASAVALAAAGLLAVTAGLPGCGDPPPAMPGNLDAGVDAVPSGPELCSDCYDRVITAGQACAVVFNACVQSADCEDYVGCDQTCRSSGPGCADQCAADHSDGRQLWQAISDCIDSACASCTDHAQTPLDVCLACMDDTLTRACADRAQACDADADCHAYDQCAGDCSTVPADAYLSCINDCGNQHPAGERLAGDLAGCQEAHCITPCNVSL